MWKPPPRKITRGPNWSLLPRISPSKISTNKNPSTSHQKDHLQRFCFTKSRDRWLVSNIFFNVHPLGKMKPNLTCARRLKGEPVLPPLGTWFASWWCHCQSSLAGVVCTQWATGNEHRRNREKGWKNGGKKAQQLPKNWIGYRNLSFVLIYRSLEYHVTHPKS